MSDNQRDIIRFSAENGAMFDEIFFSPAFEFAFLAGGAAICLMAGTFWLMYLVRIITSKDDNIERVRRFQRIAEEYMRGSN
ncbi:MAG: hypothetical protein LBP75_03455 [Planctomycetota bacterium]|jgi:hypothetical protein|nr:hypothetical protein [Planctomycetota bacterium]